MGSREEMAHSLPVLLENIHSTYTFLYLSRSLSGVWD
ncbi:hypothetical protein CTAM01_10951 [Colletotrichum tamarilloi]|uniref:Uncharacterized protein n=1 Tax=Colletotrichum tamarilloi TaxID=1209934 RepID=A0ABQ9QZ50_9PEZI|nr:uncharacterized protein CTAM01_10951 [Colletotrichum tamarilloi]KAK1490101.1 hypothetical protein CTAM01_10951 [Colletotrichum tamarilloi]